MNDLTTKIWFQIKCRSTKCKYKILIHDSPTQTIFSRWRNFLYADNWVKDSLTKFRPATKIKARSAIFFRVWQRIFRKIGDKENFKRPRGEFGHAGQEFRTRRNLKWLADGWQRSVYTGRFQSDLRVERWRWLVGRQRFDWRHGLVVL